MVIDVDQAEFQKLVVERSQTMPVIVDFWAPWCGPCRTLGPVLERLANEPNSGFILAKVNVDHNQAIARQFGVQGIPAVKAFAGGRLVDQFVGVQPESRVREFVNRVAGAFKPATAAQNGATGKVALEQARSLLRQGRGCEAQPLLERADGTEASLLRPLAAFICQPRQGRTAEVSDLYAKAAAALRQREPSGALYSLLAAFHREDAAGKAAVRGVVEGLLHLHAEDTAVQSYRAQFAA